MSHHTETLVIGAGPAGLTAAYLLSKNGRSVTVLERDPAQVGGISRTVSHNGYLFDIGGHRFFSKSKAVVDLWDEILPNDFIERPRLSRIYYRGRYYAYPLKAFEALRNLGVFTSAACMASYLYARLRPVREPKTFHAWVRNQFGERLFAIFFKTYTEKVWGMSCDAISADWAAQRIKGLDLGAAIRDGIKRSLGLRKPVRAGGPVIKTLIESFRYPRRGPGMMWEAAAARIQAQGGKVLLDRGVDSLTFDPGTGIWTVAARRADGSRETFTARHVVSSAPVRELVDSIRPRPLSTFNARALKYRDFLTVALIAKSQKNFPDNWIYIHDPSVKVGRVQNFRSWSPEMVPDADHTCLGLEYFCFEGDGLWSASDDELVALAKREIGQIGLIDPAEVVDACVVRQAKAYPVYDEEYADHVATIRRELERDFPTLHLVGRNGMHKYNNQDHAMMTAMLTVENILANQRRHDVWRVNEDAEYTEAGESGAEAALGSERLVPRKVA
ncbi:MULTISPECIES: NAD(P)/FAD-dependent oxidoreductase [unclassified Methylobacterium]|jgi:protoporphyrinogen oxidase|uniref:NAD(P)/FAD-dependent oxidoreductase n=1 Tax=unclassified Methylobacterium TaxID=2615210 RepID=UPI0013542688|nr:NAD(P)/FAD-dependent oxidoreductase [Methylobacterium sp. 2A]MWV23081.1 NAD(P)/FAD-dependent oxidoreductase [Methylobacterium sp. 2A]